MNTDPIADYLTRIRNASSAGLKMVQIPASNLKKSMTEILFDQGFYFDFLNEKPFFFISLFRIFKALGPIA